MPNKDTTSPARAQAHSPGYRLTTLATTTGDPTQRTTDTKERDQSIRASLPSHLALTANDTIVAIAADRSLRFLHFNDHGNDEKSGAPIADATLPSPIIALASRPGEQRTAVTVALADGALLEIDLDEHAQDTRYEQRTRSKPHSRVFAKGLGGELLWLVTTHRYTMAIVRLREARLPTLIAFDAATATESRRATISLASLTSVTALDPHRNDLLLAVDARHGAHVIGFSAQTDSDELQLSPIDANVRATAMAAVSSEWIAVARKGGQIMQVRNTSATGGRTATVEDVCKRLRLILERCGCGCHEHHPHPSCRDKPPCGCHGEPGRPGGSHPGDPYGGGHPGDPGGGRPGGGQPGGGQPGGGQPGGGTQDPNGGGRPGGGRPGTTVPDDEPCGERKHAYLTWTVAALRRAGAYLVATAAGGKRMAVLDQDLNVVFERFLGARGSLVATGSSGTDRLLVMQRNTAQLETWALDTYARAVRGIDALIPPRLTVDPGLAQPVTYYGRKARAATPNPHLRVCVFPVLEPGQPFGDPDQGKMQALLEPNVYDICYNYYRENSFQTLDAEFTVFGVDIAGPRKPLVLPRSFASYFYDRYAPGGLEAIMPADWAAPPVFDGTEAMTIHTAPAFGTGKDYAIPFAARWTSHTHPAYPVVVNFAGTEALQLQVTQQTGTVRNLNVTFGALSLSHGQGEDEAAFLTALGNHVTNAIRAAEGAAGLGVTVQNVVFRRIRSSTNDAEFGRLQGQLRVAASGGATQKGRITISLPGAAPAPITAIGFDSAGSRAGVLTSAGQVANYFAECLHAARFDAGEGVGLNDPQLSETLETEEDAVARTLRARISLATDKGGAGAQITLGANSGLSGTGWSTATAQPGSASTANNSNTMRDSVDLSNDVFTAAMDQIRSMGAWNPDAVRAQFADFDAMMIGFVGGCPVTVPVADRWSSADAVDFARLRMFVRYHQATDLHNPNPGDPPVTMGTDLLIGQRFNQFDPGVMSHEIGHGLGLPDLYSAAGFRDDVAYIDRWCQMAGGNSRFNHFCAWSKWFVGWIVDDPGSAALNRTIEIPMPAPSGTTTTEGWLIPVEYWDNTIRADVEAAVGTALPIGQMMKVALGSDGGVVDLIELRARGQAFSLQLPPTPAVIVTNVLEPGTDRRWAVNGLYRRSVHLLNDGRELRAVGDRFDFAASPEFPVKGTTVEMTDLRTIRGGTIPIARVRVVREAAEFIDLYFQDNVPSWRSPDIWVDWPGDNGDPNVPRTYPEGTPTDQGETVRFPSSGVEPHFLVVRPHNAGNVRAEDVKVRWFICDPPGAGDDGRWVQRDTRTMPQLEGGNWDIVPFTWNVDASTNAHQCIRAEIIDWTIPTGVDPATGDTLALGSDDVILQNNNAQKNVFDFEAAT